MVNYNILAISPLSHLSTDLFFQQNTTKSPSFLPITPHFLLHLMKQRTWPSKSDGPRFTSLPFIKKPYSQPDPKTSRIHKPTPKPKPKPRFDSPRDYSNLPYEILAKISATFTLPQLKAASLACRAWRDALQPLREGIVLWRKGKALKHGRIGVKPNVKRALECFLSGAARGSTLAMVDAGFVYWEMGFKSEAIKFYIQAARLGDSTAQCNLGISYLQANPPNYDQAVKWLYEASVRGHVRAQYQFALCLHQGRGVRKNLRKAAKWYLQAAEGGYMRAMYNTSLCYLLGEGLPQSHKLARKWMKKAADCGHSKAQAQHGLSLFSEGEMMKALVYLELATRAGETAAAHAKNVILQQLTEDSRVLAIEMAENWRALPSSRGLYL